MAQFELEEATRANGTPVGTGPAAMPLNMAPGRQMVTSDGDERATLSAYAKELDLYYAGCNTFEGMEPDEVMQRIAAMVARLTEIRARLHRLGTTRATQLRTKEVDPLLDSLKLLFSIYSRLLASRQFDFEVTRGAV